VPSRRSPAGAKAAVRRELLARRLGIADLRAPAEAVTAHVLALPTAVAGGCLAAYVPIGSEPGSLALLDELARCKVRVLLPVVAGVGLDWAAYDGTLVPGPWGLREPAGTRLGPGGLAAADVVLVPALAVDRRGTRLGKGAGFYDRALADARGGTPLVALLHDGELLDEPLPAEPHDIAMTAAITPAGGLIELRSS